MPKKILLIDGDIYAYKAATSVERPTNWGNIWTLHADADEATRMFNEDMQKILEELDAAEVVIALTCAESNWRKTVMPTYKSNRKETRKPLVLPALREYITANYNTYIRPGLEADDILGILATHPTLVKGDKVIVSGDKDLFTIPSQVYRQGKLYQINPGRAAYNHMYQTLVGDSTDGYPGCPGVGPVAATRLLDAATISYGVELDVQVATWWAVVVEAFRKAGLGEVDALVNARVARICHAQDYDLKNKKVIEWNPPQVAPVLPPQEEPQPQANPAQEQKTSSVSAKANTSASQRKLKQPSKGKKTSRK